jgi:putative ABC transport system permease protein
MGAAMKKDYPQVEQFTRIYASEGPQLVKKGPEYIWENRIAFVDSTFFDVFTFPALSGNPRTALHEPNSAVISASAAMKYFGTKQAVGRTLDTKYAGNTLFKVNAVIDDMPANSHFRFDVLLSIDNVDYGFGNFLSHNFHTYLLLRPDADYHDLEKQFPAFVNRYVLPQAGQVMEVKSMEEFEQAGNKLEYSLMPLLQLHLQSDRFPELGVNSRREYIWIFSAVALFILLLACINFMNLSTARSAARAREVGIRKVMGTDRRALISQFITESVLTVCLALVIAVALAWLVLPWFNNLAAKSLQISSLFKPVVLPLLILLPVLVGLMAGLYPAFFLSRFQPIRVLKSQQGSGFRKSSLRSALVVFQFATSIILMIGTIVVYRQLNYIQTTSLGYQKEQLLILEGTGMLEGNADAFRNELLSIPGIKGVTFSGYLPVHPSARSDNSFSKEAVMDPRNAFNQQIWEVDYDYLPVMGMQMAEGRWFSRDYGSDSTGIVINESAASILGYKDPIGKKLYSSDNPTQGMNLAFTIIGVVKNFHFESLRQNVGPLTMRLGRFPMNTVVKLETADLPALLRAVEGRWKRLAPDMPFVYRFMDEGFDGMYRAEQRMGSVGLSFALLAILIACLGLFGLVTYMAEQRTREIGVRKVLGASVQSIVRMMSRDFLRLVLVASLIAFPIAYLMMNRWLEDYAFRIGLGWWVFVAAALVTLLIAFLTVSLQSVRAARANPIKALKNE